ncbi:DUF190 domain-containing protein [Streptomyces hiroshimensis]|uniref:DUF190 domain-containing protein n=1 Tax=Streptomyces hiroshimensis TaxID=66424 RepID=A0ABQ2Y734_9ACTN|nr:DUF190 domain-containing protein [Streptomyces hiroshimensis]GGX69789.1 hypothetical protein GCM10010324_13480 [Streptomyces hiroshimensis]
MTPQGRPQGPQEPQGPQGLQGPQGAKLRGGGGAGALRLTVFLTESDRWGHHPLSSEIVHRAHAAGLAGATVFRGSEGYGASSVVHTARLLSLSEDLPVTVVIVDAEEAVRAFLPALAEVAGEKLVTLEPVEVLRLGPVAPEGGA